VVDLRPSTTSRPSRDISSPKVHPISKANSSYQKILLHNQLCSFKFPIVLCELCFVLHFHSFIPRDALLSAVYAVVVCRMCVCVCLCVCVSVTLQYCIKTAKRRITQSTPHDSPMTRFLMPNIMTKFERNHPLRGRQMQVGSVKIRHFRRKTRYNSKTVQGRRIVSIKVVCGNSISFLLFFLVCFYMYVVF